MLPRSEDSVPRRDPFYRGGRTGCRGGTRVTEEGGQCPWRNLPRRDRLSCLVVMHPDLQQCLALLAVVRLLTLAAATAPAPFSRAGTRRDAQSADDQLIGRLAAARPPRPRRAGAADCTAPARLEPPTLTRPTAPAGGRGALSRTRRGRRGQWRPRGSAAGTEVADAPTARRIVHRCSKRTVSKTASAGVPSEYQRTWLRGDSRKGRRPLGARECTQR